MKDRKHDHSGTLRRLVIQMVFCLQNANATRGYVKYFCLNAQSKNQFEMDAAQRTKVENCPV